MIHRLQFQLLHKPWGGNHGECILRQRENWRFNPGFEGGLAGFPGRYIGFQPSIHTHTRTYIYIYIYRIYIYIYTEYIYIQNIYIYIQNIYIYIYRIYIYIQNIYIYIYKYSIIFCIYDEFIEIASLDDNQANGWLYDGPQLEKIINMI